MDRRVLPIILSVGLAMGGCAKLSHLQQLLTLKALVDSQRAETQYVKERTRDFDRLLQDIEDGKIKKGRSARWIRKTYGPPVLSPTVRAPGASVEQWLYRYPTTYFHTDKVYLYFDKRTMKLRDWVVVRATAKASHKPGPGDQTAKGPKDKK